MNAGKTYKAEWIAMGCPRTAFFKALHITKAGNARGLYLDAGAAGVVLILITARGTAVLGEPAEPQVQTAFFLEEAAPPLLRIGSRPGAAKWARHTVKKEHFERYAEV